MYIRQNILLQNNTTSWVLVDRVEPDSPSSAEFDARSHVQIARMKDCRAYRKVKNNKNDDCNRNKCQLL